MLILASQSPRRRALLSQITDDFVVRPTGCDETLCCADPAEHVRLLACRKAEAALREQAPGPADAIVAADTVVYLEGDILEKPVSVEEAAAMLRRLSGRENTVCTGVAVVYQGRLHSFTCKTEVRFYDLTETEIAEYVASGEPMDKAGAYAIQGRGALLVREIRGDYCNVVGLPVAPLFRLLRELGVPLKEGARP